MKSYAWSTLQMQHQLLGPRFALRYAHDWLVWEPGAWSVPRGNISAADTLLPKKQGPKTPAKGDPLCFVLEQQFSIGRAEGNTLVLSDETVSRHHCTFEHRDGGWWLQRHPEAKNLTVDGAAIAASVAVRLMNGQHIELGQVVLTYMSAIGLVARLKAPHG